MAAKNRPDIVFDEAEHIYLVNGVEVPSVTTILQPLSNRLYSAVNPSVLEYARRRGTAVHEALEMYDLGGDLEVTPETEGYIRAYLEWGQIYKPKWTAVEQIVYHTTYFSNDSPTLPDGMKVDFIGTLDRAGYLNGREFAVVDIKTSTPTKEALVSVCCQTAAYANAVFDWDKPSRYGLFLKADGTYRFLDCKEYEKKYGFSGNSVFFSLLDTHRLIDKVLATGGKK